MPMEAVSSGACSHLGAGERFVYPTGRRSWQLRYAILQNEYFYWFKSQDDVAAAKAPLGEINVLFGFARAKEGSCHGKKLAFEYVASDKT